LNVRLTLAYDGTAFSGWQVQPDRRTVQGEVRDALESICGHSVRLIGAGRTDAGVHALGQVANARLNTRIPPRGLRSLLRRRLPPDVEVLRVEQAPETFDARRSALSRTYEYRFVERADLFRRRYALGTGPGLDVPRMTEACREFLGEHDFTSFCSSREEGVRLCRVVETVLLELGDEWVFRIKADHFLYNMVRVMAGTLLELGRGRRPGTSVRDIIERRDRKAAGVTAPPQGLFLVEVEYGAPVEEGPGNSDRD
jgi:tRNA pseudouridine38-40 synthase